MDLQASKWIKPWSKLFRSSAENFSSVHCIRGIARLSSLLFPKEKKEENEGRFFAFAMLDYVTATWKNKKGSSQLQDIRRFW